MYIFSLVFNSRNPAASFQKVQSPISPFIKVLLCDMMKELRARSESLPEAQK